MPFKENILTLQKLCTNAPNKMMYSNSIFPSPNQLPNLVLLYPGRIPNRGDYRLEFHNQALSHTDMVRAVYECTLNGHGENITAFLVEIYYKGLNAQPNYDFYITIANHHLNMDQFKQLVYWLILQEDINYPRPRFMGVRMPILRYIEGAVAAAQPNLLSLERVFRRTNNHGGPPPAAFQHQALYPYLSNNLNQI